MDYFVKESYGTIWHFYHNAHGICFCKMKDENLTEYQVLLPDGSEDFDIIVDDSNTLHLFCSNENGDILYLTHFNDSWRKTTLLKSKNPTKYKKNFKVLRVNNWLNLFYCIEYNGNRMLTHQIIDNSDATPQVIDSVSGDFCATQDDYGNIYLLFYSKTKKSFGTKKYVWSKKQWDDFLPIPEICDCANTFLYIDNENTMHIMYETDSYVREYVDKKIIVHGSGNRPVMLNQGREIIMWEGVLDNKIFIKNKGDENPTVFMPGGFAKPVMIKLRYTSYEPNIKADCCLGNIQNGSVRTYGINNFFVISQTPPAPKDATLPQKQDFNNANYLELQKLKIQIGQLNNMIEKIQNSIEGLDVQKLNRRLDDVEATVDRKIKNKFLIF